MNIGIGPTEKIIFFAENKFLMLKGHFPASGFKIKPESTERN
jgi:hypothetical protein